VTYFPNAEESSPGGLRTGGRSCRLFETACSRNDDFPFASLRLCEKLSLCDLLTFLLNIFDDRWTYRDGDTRYALFLIGRLFSSVVVFGCVVIIKVVERCCRCRVVVLLVPGDGIRAKQKTLN
jgi:hypothetical protein